MPKRIAIAAILLLSCSVAWANDMPSSSSDPYNGPHNSIEHWHHLRQHGSRDAQEYYLEQNAHRIRFLEQKIQMLAEHDSHLKQVEIEYIETATGSPLKMIEMRERVRKDHVAIRRMLKELHQRRAIEHSLERHR